MSAKETAKESPLMARVKARFQKGDTLLFTHSFKGDDTVVVRADEILTVMDFLKSDPALDFDIILDVTVVDYWTKKGVRPASAPLQPYLKESGARYEVVYHLYSVGKNHRIRVKAPLAAATPQINSVTSLWVGADWLEREAWDLYGVVFRGHPDLRRILLYEAFQGHPLRKDYEKTARQPLIGPRN
ncbi:MAG: NADH-quinone oxidoreductase subunit C [Nitrospinae bacterium]|nr:NADH-quinone oxidoreductase subunit C [Nitrospinota bacterium]